MGQVPEFKHLIVGDGRMAHFFKSALAKQTASVVYWRRSSQELAELHSLAKKSTYTLLCINDKNILPYSEELKDSGTQCVHFSGALEIDNVFGFHPLMTFSRDTNLDQNGQSFPFVGTCLEKTFRQVFPNFNNPYIQILADQKPLYHGLCVLGGNGTTLLWELVAKEFARLGITKGQLKPYIEQITTNVVNDSADRFTGPWYRNDTSTISTHQQEFKNQPLSGLYEQLHNLSKTVEGSL